MSNKNNILLCYIAGSYRGKTIYETKKNIERAENLAEELAIFTKNVYPVTPHCNTRFWEGLRDEEFFIEGTKELMRRCNCVLIVPKSENSVGTQGEIEEAERLGIPVFHNIVALEKWLKD